MIPAIPVEFLVPLALLVAGMCFSLVSLILLRRAWILVRGRKLDSLTYRIESTLLGFLAGEVPPEGVAAWLVHPERKRIQALVRAVVHVETSGHADLRDRIRAAGLPQALARALEKRPGKTGLLRADRWTRAAAARALGTLGMSEGLPALERALDDEDAEVAYAAAWALAALHLPEAADAILRRMGKGTRLNNARLAALVAPMRCDLAGALRSVFERADDPVAIFWALELVGERRLYDLVEEVKPHLGSTDANVRASAAEALGRLRVPLTDRWLGPLLADEAWFVRCHAARALGEIGAAWAAPEIGRLLDDKQWWVRHNAAEALVALGEVSVHVAEDVLFGSSDEFARNTAVYVLERLGWVERTIAAATLDGAAARKARAALETFALSGGIGHLENALGTAPLESLPMLLDLLASLGDDATYGRIRACLDRMPEALKPRALEVANALRGT